MRHRATREEAGGSTRAVQRALALLVAVVDLPDPTLTRLAAATDLSPSTASRLLSTLVHVGFAERDADQRYGPGAQLTRIAAVALRADDLYDLAGPSLQRLAAQTGEVASLAIAIDGDRALYLRQVAGSHRVQTQDWTGRTIPRARTAVGAALDRRVDAAGVAWARNTVEPDVTAVAVPVVGRDGSVVAALNVIAPSYRTSDADVASHGTALVTEAGRLSALLGGLDAIPIRSPEEVLT